MLHVSEKREMHTIFVQKYEAKSHLGRPRQRWENNIKLNLIGWEGMEYI
jgi:hypothetical protein